MNQNQKANFEFLCSCGLVIAIETTQDRESGQAIQPRSLWAKFAGSDISDEKGLYGVGGQPQDWLRLLDS